MLKAKISDVKANLLNPALTSHYEVQIPLPPFMQAELESKDQYRLRLQCSEASLPGSNIATTDISNDFTGVTERHAYRRMFDESMDFTFYVDGENYLPIKFFEKWMKGVMNEDVNESMNLNYHYRARYPDEPRKGYACPQGLVIQKFEKSYWENGHSGLVEYEFIKAWPKAMNSMPLSYDGSNLLKCTVSMTYMRYVMRGLDRGTISSQAVRPPQNTGAGNRNNPWVDFGVDMLNEFTGLNIPNQAAQRLVNYFQ